MITDCKTEQDSTEVAQGDTNAGLGVEQSMLLLLFLQSRGSHIG
jgi:hypothetical protein